MYLVEMSQEASGRLQDFECCNGCTPFASMTAPFAHRGALADPERVFYEKGDRAFVPRKNRELKRFQVGRHHSTYNPPQLCVGLAPAAVSVVVAPSCGVFAETWLPALFGVEAGCDALSWPAFFLLKSLTIRAT